MEILIALVELKNTGNSKSLSEEYFDGLVLNICIFTGAKVVLPKNCVNIRLSNSLIGIIQELLYNNNKVVPRIWKFYFIEFADYARLYFFPNNKSRRN